MTKYIAFLRAINVGGHIVKMEVLRARFEQLGFTNVETFIASGNVIFEARGKQTLAHERAIEADLERALGYAVATFVRTPAEVATIAAYQPFPPAAFAKAGAFNIGLVKMPLSEDAQKKLYALRNEVDDFHVHGREVYWLSRTRQSDSKFSNAVFERVTKQAATWRNVNTFRRLAAKYN